MADPVRETVFEWWKDVVREMWRNPEFLLPALELSEEEPAAVGKELPLASVGMPGDSKLLAIGDSLIRRAAWYRLRISDRLLAMPPEDIRKILVHEAAHLGYPNHGKDFRELVRKHGGSVSESALEEDVIQVQRRLPSQRRYETVRTFPGGEERAAALWVRGQARAEPGSRWRTLQGLDVERELEGLDGRRSKKPKAPAKSLIERLEDVTSGFGPESPLDYLYLAREVEPDVDEHDVEAVKRALMSYLQNEYDLAREAERKA